MLSRNCRRFAVTRRFPPGFIGLTVNVVLMRLRTSHGKPVSLDTGGTTEDSAESTIMNACPVDDLHLTGAIDRIAIHRALRKLPPGYRTIFLLHDVEGKGAQRDRTRARVLDRKFEIPASSSPGTPAPFSAKAPGR